MNEKVNKNSHPSFQFSFTSAFQDFATVVNIVCYLVRYLKFSQDIFFGFQFIGFWKMMAEI